MSVQRTEPAADGFLSRAYWIDADAQANFDQAIRQTYVPFSGQMALGYGNFASWIRFRIPASAEPKHIYIQPIWLDSLTLFDPATHQPPMVRGDRYPLGKGWLSGIDHEFTLVPHPEDRDVYLRVHTTSSQLVYAQLLSTDELTVKTRQKFSWMSLYLGVMLLIFIFLGGAWFAKPEPILGVFLLKHVSFCVYLLFNFGLMSMWLTPWLTGEAIDDLFAISIFFLIPLNLLFDSLLLHSYQVGKWWIRALFVLAMGPIVFALMYFLGWQSKALELNGNAILVVAVLLWLSAINTKSLDRSSNPVPRKIVIGYYTIISSLAFASVAGFVGLFGPQEMPAWRIYSVVWHGLLSALMMSFLLLYRGHSLSLSAQAARLELEQARKRARWERSRREEQSQFLHMLMHELKTPLSVVSLALRSGLRRPDSQELARQATQDMKAVLDRCLEADQFGDEDLKPKMEPIQLQAFLNQVLGTFEDAQQRVRVNGSWLGILRTDEQFLRIALTNLLNNALRYSPKESVVFLDVRPCVRDGHEGVIFEVSNLPGQAGRPDPDQLFKKYYRSAGARRLSGSGLGLTVSRQIIRRLGGEIDYLSNDERVAFGIWIPSTKV